MKEIVYDTNTEFYHGTKRKPADQITNLGFNGKYESYAYVTPDPEYAAGYGFKTKPTVLAFKPKRPIRILILDSKFIKDTLRAYGEESIPDNLLLNAYKKSKSGLKSNAARAKAAREILNGYKRYRITPQSENITKYNVLKSMKVKEYFGEGSRWLKNHSKTQVPYRFKTINNEGILSRMFYRIGCVGGTSIDEMRKYLKVGRNKISNVSSVIALSPDGKGYQRLSAYVEDFIVVHYLLKRAYELGFDGIQMVTKGYVGNNGTIHSNSPEIVIKKGLLKRGPEYYWDKKSKKLVFVKNAPSGGSGGYTPPRPQPVQCVPNSGSPNKTNYLAGALIVFVNKGGQKYVLIQLRAKWMKSGLYWTVPGGGKDKADRGNMAVTAMREAFEETGINFKPYADKVREVWADKKHKIKYFTVTVPENVKINEKIKSQVELADVNERNDWPSGSINSPKITKGHKWVPMSQIDSLKPPMFENLIETIKKAAGESSTKRPSPSTKRPSPSTKRPSPSNRIKQMKVANLKQYAKNRGFKGFSGLKKANLQKFILNRIGKPAPAPASVPKPAPVPKPASVPKPAPVPSGSKTLRNRVVAMKTLKNLQQIAKNRKIPGRSKFKIKAQMENLRRVILQNIGPSSSTKRPSSSTKRPSSSTKRPSSSTKNRNRIIEINRDGECLFNSIAFGIYYYTNPGLRPANIKTIYKPLAKKLRKIAVNELLKIARKGNYNNTLFQGMLSDNRINQNLPDKERLKKYIQMMAKSCSWGGHLEIKVLTEAIHKLGFKGIQVYDDRNLSKIQGMQTNMNNSKKLPVIKLVLENVRRGGLHFNFLV